MDILAIYRLSVHERTRLTRTIDTWARSIFCCTGIVLFTKISIDRNERKSNDVDVDDDGLPAPTATGDRRPLR